jgi:FKBP-type peptidyl-prolyl cis-trans isomerase
MSLFSLLLLLTGTTTALTVSRRSILLAPTALPLPGFAADLQFSTVPSSGLQWADAKVGSGLAPRPGSPVAIDYVMSTTGARYGTKIYSTADKNAPFRWVLGDGSAIQGLELAVQGDGELGVPPMLPGGVRRVIIPSTLGYESLAKPIPGMQFQDCQEGKGPGPIPPVPEAFEEFQRFKNIYCNANRPYQPDLVMDIKLYGQRQ